MAGAMSSGLGYFGIKTGLFNLIAHKGPLAKEHIVSDTNCSLVMLRNG